MNPNLELVRSLPVSGGVTGFPVVGQTTRVHTFDRRARPASPVARPAKPKADRIAMPPAEMTPWTAARSGAGAQVRETRPLAHALRAGPVDGAARWEAIVMALLFVFAVSVIVLQFAAAFGINGFISGLNEFVRRALL